MSGRSRRQALGQHFLADPDVATRIVDAVGATPDDLVCEIGAGSGALTGLLLARAGRLVALELDPALHRRLQARARPGAPLDLRLADARSFAYETLATLRPAPGGRVLVVGNLPYAASKPILQRLFEARRTLAAATLMLQLEVAERLCAAPGSRVYGALSVLWQLWADVRLLFRVPPVAFRPPPAVESAVVRAVFRASPRVPVQDEAAFVKVVKAAFAHRRKTLANGLRTAGSGLPAHRVAAALEEASLDGGRRAETLSLEEFARLARSLGAPPGAC